MDATTRRVRNQSHAGVLGAIADRQRRRLLEILQSRAGPVTEEGLATRLAADETGRSPDDVPATAVESRRVDVSHAHLPALAAVELIDHDREAGTVAATDHPAFDDPKFEQVVGADAPEWDEVLDCLADARRRTVLSVLVRRGDAIDRSDLVRSVAEREGGPGGTADDESTEQLRSALHHSHLPKLDDVGLIDDDVGAATVAYEGHPALEREWLDVDPGDTQRPILPSASRVEDRWRLEGRAQIAERGRALYDSADDELLVLLATEGLVEAACRRRLQSAVERGVDVYVASPSSSVRDRLREDVPGVTLWEPGFDWQDASPDGAVAGRLVLADRSAILFGTGGSAVDDAGAERAITATGADDAVVLWLRELLGSRLDGLVGRSEGTASEISH